MSTIAAFAPEQLTLGQEIDRLYEIREKIRAAEEKVKELKAVFDQRQTALMERLDQEQCPKAVGSKASVSISEIVVPQVENWDEFYRYIGRNKAFHLLERRPSAGAYRELIAQRTKPVPGVVSFTKRTLNLRTV